MTQDDTIRMAREAGWTGPEDNAVYFSMLKRLIELARATEREAIAQMFEASPELVRLAQNDQGGCIICGSNPYTEAKAIRARGNT